MRTTDYKVGDVVILSDGKRYKYLGVKTMGEEAEHAYEPLEATDFAIRTDCEVRYAPFSWKLHAKTEPEPKRKWYQRFADWWKASNRWKHFLFAIPLGAVCGSDFTAGVGIGMEIKDGLYGNKPDIVDFLLTAVGGLIGHWLMRLVGWDYLIGFLINLIF